MTKAISPAIASAVQLVSELCLQGVRDFVLCPGSRSAPLAYAVAAGADAGKLRLHVRVDERSVGFLALGLAKGSERPVAVVTTSGTAVANLHPAVLEATHAQVPLILLTADRPHELRGTGANQTTDQAGIFGTAVRLSVDVPAPCGLPSEARDVAHLAARAVGAAAGWSDFRPGPVHLNLAYREPLAPDAWPLPPELAEEWSVLRGPVVDTAAARSGATAGAFTARGSEPFPGSKSRRTVVVAGEGAGLAARQLAEAQGWPLFAEPSSGVVGGPNYVTGYRHLLTLPALAEQIEQVLVMGRPNLSRPVQALLGRSDVRVTVFSPTGAPWPDAARSAARVVGSLDVSLLRLKGTPAPAPSEFLQAWQRASLAAAGALDAVTSQGDETLDPLTVARLVAAATGPNDALVVGPSSPARDLDLVAALDLPAESGRRLDVLANRGLAGIDGLVSTAAGVALARADVAQTGRELGRTRALLGDLTFLHDVGGLAVGALESAPDLQIVVLNDQGGGIFGALEHGDLAECSAVARQVVRRVFTAPPAVDLGAVSRGFGARHVLVETDSQLKDRLADPQPGIEVLEVAVRAADRPGRDATVRAAILTAAQAALGA